MRRGLMGSAMLCLAAAWSLPAQAQLSNDTVKIGVATDLSSLYADINRSEEHTSELQSH